MTSDDAVSRLFEPVRNHPVPPMSDKLREVVDALGNRSMLARLGGLPMPILRRLRDLAS